MKKKGLIVATIVMVLVLAVSLTTATYAWFSTQAEATIEGVSITTTATEGLQIGVVTTNSDYDGYVFGGIEFDAANDFTGENGWGALADFSNLKESLGTVEDAVTLVEDVSKYTNKVYKEVTYSAGAVYYFDKATAKMVLAESEQEVGTIYYVLDDTVAIGDYLVPIAYNAAIEPIFFTKAVANGDGNPKSADYLVLPIGVRATMDVAIILCTITVTPDIAQISNTQYAPGMAAACYITLSDGTTEVTIKAYPEVQKGTTGATGTGKNELTWSYNFVVLGDVTGTITALTAQDITYTIWIEGEDDMCDNLTAGSGFEVDIDYKYEESAAGILTKSDDGKTITVANSLTAANNGVYNIIF